MGNAVPYETGVLMWEFSVIMTHVKEVLFVYVPIEADIYSSSTILYCGPGLTTEYKLNMRVLTVRI